MIMIFKVITILLLFFFQNLSAYENSINGFDYSISINKVKSNPLVITAIGNTGVGKSSLLNLFANETAFEENNTAEPVTKLTTKKMFHFMGEPNEIEVALVDTQGLQENSRQDSNNIAQMVEEFRRSDKINLFLLCLESSNPRYTDYLDSTIKTFIRIFGDDFLNHVALVFNKWNYAVYSDNEKLKRTNEFQVIMEEKFGIKQIPCFFIDSYFNKKIERINQVTGETTFDNLPPWIMRKNELEIFQFLSYLKSKKTFLDSHNAKKVKSQIDEMNERIETAETRVKEQLREIIGKLSRELMYERERYGPLGIVGNVVAAVARGIARLFGV